MKCKIFLPLVLLTSFVSASALADTNEYDEQGRIIKTVYDDGRYDVYEYNGNNHSFKSSYDAQGVLLSDSMTDYDENHNIIYTDEYTYSPDGRNVSQKIYDTPEAIASNEPNKIANWADEINGLVGYEDGKLSMMGNVNFSYDENGRITSSRCGGHGGMVPGDEVWEVK